MPGLEEQLDDFEPPDRGSHRWKEWKNKNTTREDVFHILQQYHDDRVMPLYREIAYLRLPLYKKAWLTVKGFVQTLWDKVPPEYRKPAEQWTREHVTGPLRVYWRKAKTYRFGLTYLWRALEWAWDGLTSLWTSELMCERCGERPADTADPVGPDDQYLCGDCLKENLEAI